MKCIQKELTGFQFRDLRQVDCFNRSALRKGPVAHFFNRIRQNNGFQIDKSLESAGKFLHLTTVGKSYCCDVVCVFIIFHIEQIKKVGDNNVFSDHKFHFIGGAGVENVS